MELELAPPGGASLVEAQPAAVAAAAPAAEPAAAEPDAAAPADAAPASAPVPMDFGEAAAESSDDDGAAARPSGGGKRFWEKLDAEDEDEEVHTPAGRRAAALIAAVDAPPEVRECVSALIGGVENVNRAPTRTRLKNQIRLVLGRKQVHPDVVSESLGFSGSTLRNWLGGLVRDKQCKVERIMYNWIERDPNPLLLYEAALAVVRGEDDDSDEDERPVRGTSEKDCPACQGAHTRHICLKGALARKARDKERKEARAKKSREAQERAKIRAKERAMAAVEKLKSEGDDFVGGVKGPPLVEKVDIRPTVQAFQSFHRPRPQPPKPTGEDVADR